ncbi:MAG: hypothetical protein QXM93_07350 [Candidatus Methanomethyliaceae archaeon]
MVNNKESSEKYFYIMPEEYFEEDDWIRKLRKWKEQETESVKSSVKSEEPEKNIDKKVE